MLLKNGVINYVQNNNSREEQIGKIHDSAERAMKIAYAPRIQFKTIAALGS